jgi:hypothetical protein
MKRLLQTPVIPDDAGAVAILFGWLVVVLILILI